MPIYRRVNTVKWKQFTRAEDFWYGMVVPDYEELLQDSTNLRHALHTSISLLHMSDWVFHTHGNSVKDNFTVDRGKGKHGDFVVRSPKDFQRALEQINDDFGRIYSIASAAKHLKLGDLRPVKYAASHAANTAVRTATVGADSQEHTGSCENTRSTHSDQPKITLEGDNGSDIEFSVIAKNVYEMWGQLIVKYDWF